MKKLSSKKLANEDVLNLQMMMKHETHENLHNDIENPSTYQFLEKMEVIREQEMKYLLDLE